MIHRMSGRIVSLNIRQGGGGRIEQLETRLLGYDADILVITEFRRNERSDLQDVVAQCLGVGLV